MSTYEMLVRLGMAVGLGLLVGLPRERKGDELAGIRTFALLTVFGTIAGFLSTDYGNWIVPAGALAVGGLMAAGAILKARNNQLDIGLTTEVAALVMYALGAYLAKGDKALAVVLGGTITLLLYWKSLLHGFVQRMGDQDVAAIMRFVMIALVILPILPRERFGPYHVFSPFETWLVVVLVVGISLVGYVLYKLVPASAGALLGGAIGGLVSSTATTVSYARRTKANPQATPLAMQAIMMATTVSVLRVLFLLSIFADGLLATMAPPLLAMMAIMALLCAAAYWMGRHRAVDMPTHGNPAELRSALLFGAIYAVVKLATAYGREHFGQSGLYVVGGISGLTDVDAITLSLSDMARQGLAAATQSATSPTTQASVGAALAWRVILVAILSNLVFKSGCIIVLGNNRLRGWMAALFGASMLGGIAILYFWPS